MKNVYVDCHLRKSARLHYLHDHYCYKVFFLFFIIWHWWCWYIVQSLCVWQQLSMLESIKIYYSSVLFYIEFAALFVYSTRVALPFLRQFTMTLIKFGALVRVFASLWERQKKNFDTTVALHWYCVEYQTLPCCIMVSLVHSSIGKMFTIYNL